VWYLNGTTTIGYGALDTVADPNWTIAGTGDLNSDGKTDLVWSNRQLNTAIDVAGNTIATAFDVGTLNGSGAYSDTVGGFDTSDFYKFSLLSTSNITLTLTGFANAEVYNSSGTLITNFTGLAADTYYVRVYATSAGAKYTLSLTGNSLSPDLVGNSLSLTNTSGTPITSIIAGQQFKVNFSGQNIGNSAVSSPFTVTFYLSKDGTIDTSDYSLGTYNVTGSVAAGGTFSGISTFTLPLPTDAFWNNTPGTYYIGMILDSGNAIAETSETNNSNLGLTIDSATTSVILQDIDLTGVNPEFNLKTLSNTTLTSGFAGQKFNANFQIKNAGTTDTNAAFTVAFYISTDSQIDASDKLLGTYDITDFSSLTANGGHTGTLTKNLTLPPIGDPFWTGLTGNYYIGMLIDSNNTIIETNETNNSSVGVDTDYEKVKISQNAVDLQAVASGFTVTNPLTQTVGNVSAGAAFDLNFALTNTGNTDAGSFKVAFYVSTDNKYDPATDRLLTSSNDPNTTFYYTVNSLLAGATNLFSLNQANNNELILPGVADDFWSKGNGTYYIGMVIDADPNNPNTLNNGVIDEVDEKNNYSTGLTTDLGANIAQVNVTAVSGIDLAGTALTPATTSAGVNTPFSVDFTVANTKISNAGAFRVSFYLSTDTNITKTDTFVGFTGNPSDPSNFNLSKFTGLAGNSSQTRTTSLTITGIAPGNYYLGMIVDSLNEVKETDEGNNNTQYIAFTVT
jgi:subtilase family serine protease